MIMRNENGIAFDQIGAWRSDLEALSTLSTIRANGIRLKTLCHIRVRFHIELAGIRPVEKSLKKIAKSRMRHVKLSSG